MACASTRSSHGQAAAVRPAIYRLVLPASSEPLPEDTGRRELRIRRPGATDGAAAIGLRKNDGDLKAQIDKSIADMIKDGTYKKIQSKYLTSSPA
ncbi:transporter substrate-binding domain-containing protein [Burkholderia anthina]|uniref:transporter substrate-binding domain-containing protein n=1 Tax=Burkholderia anthina TaxID=179879 RepID=UPI0037C056C5